MGAPKRPNQRTEAAYSVRASQGRASSRCSCEVGEVVNPDAMTEWNARMLDAAEALADRCKWSVFPLHGIRADGCCTCGTQSCPNVGKHPADGIAWKSEATTNALTVVRWFGGESIRNVGIHLRTSGLAVIDIDGTDALKLFGSRFGKVEKSPLVARSGRVDGWHLYYSAVGLDVPKVACDGIELRVGDHYMVAPPSRHKSGRDYAWFRGDPVEEAGSLPPVPELIREWAAEKAAPIRSEVSRVVAMDRIPEGGRREHLLRWAGSLRGKGVVGDDLRDHLLIENRKCDPPLSDDEVAALARDVTKRYATTHPITPSEWGEPLPLDTGLDASEPFPVDALPAWLGAYCEAWAETSQTPVDAIAVLTLGAFATAIQGRVVVRLSPDWTEQTCLFVMLVMLSGTKKSATFSEAFHPILQAERALRIDLEPQLADAENRVEIAKGRADSARKAAQSKAQGDARVQAEQTFIDAKDELHEAESRQRTLTPPLFYADDTTPEAFVDLLAIHERMTIASAEGGWFGTFAGRYSEGRANFDALLKGYSGDGIRVHRKGRDMVDIPNAICSVVVAIQPDVLREMAGTPGATERGLLARFVKAAPPTLRGYRNVTNPKSVPMAVRDAYAARLSVVLHELREGFPVEVQLDADARAVFTVLREQHELESRPGGRVHDIDLWAEKYVGNVARIAAILHFADHTTEAAALQISAATLNAAIRIGDYFIEQEIKLNAYAGQSRDVVTVRRILDWIIEEPRDAFTTRDVFQAKRGTTGLDTTVGVRRVLSLLAEYGYIQPVESTTSGSGRPSETWLVNPAAYPQNPQNLSQGGFEDIEDASGEIVEAA